MTTILTTFYEYDLNKITKDCLFFNITIPVIIIAENNYIQHINNIIATNNIKHIKTYGWSFKTTYPFTIINKINSFKQTNLSYTNQKIEDICLNYLKPYFIKFCFEENKNIQENIIYINFDLLNSNLINYSNYKNLSIPHENIRTLEHKIPYFKDKITEKDFCLIDRKYFSTSLLSIHKNIAFEFSTNFYNILNILLRDSMPFEQNIVEYLKLTKPHMFNNYYGDCEDIINNYNLFGNYGKSMLNNFAISVDNYLPESKKLFKLLTINLDKLDKQDFYFFMEIMRRSSGILFEDVEILYNIIYNKF